MKLKCVEYLIDMQLTSCCASDIEARYQHKYTNINTNTSTKQTLKQQATYTNIDRRMSKERERRAADAERIFWQAVLLGMDGWVNEL